MRLYDVFSDLTRVETRLWDRLDLALREEIDVPLGRFEAMLVMRRLGTCRILDISRELSVTIGGTSKLVDRLEGSRLCTRTPNPHDRRSSLITLAAEALPLLERGEAVIEGILSRTLGAHLNDAELGQLRRQLAILRHASNPAASELPYPTGQPPLIGFLNDNSPPRSHVGPGPDSTGPSARATPAPHGQG